MKKQRFSEEQIVRMLRQAETAKQTVAEVCKEHGVSEQTWYRWKKKFGQMEVPDVRRLRELEKENGRLKRIVAERDLEIDAMKEVLKTNFRGRSTSPGGGPVAVAWGFAAAVV
ncbi:MAG: transposase [Phycisphaerae bacterium]|nr:transposase [Phycisphaerae bacterium]